ncbi:hypothetical protein Patl1_11857 [Pistacia atlantica]|uniref:Uncharacterized protein n=1 Tax=Pistacia atlantica TaxID=434234 RepID=A0ACC1A397_9ROSI|nr:hypothetical protein Patl1_11857 [Pistacia atlantica]
MTSATIIRNTSL